MSAPDVRDGLLEAFMRRQKRAVRYAVLCALIGIVPLLVLFGWLFLRVTWLEQDNARLRAACGIQESR